ncbi:cellulase family glycosylhydrolase [Halomicrobium salinisoli]|nr:cellulase family glycosylhydrolase [Halomicrobium salinisoli]
MKATGAAGALAVGVGPGLTGSAAGNIDPEGFKALEINSDNQIVTEDGEVFKMRGLNVPDPKRVEITKNVRGKDFEQQLDMVTDNANGWHPRVIRIPAQPTDIGEHPNGNTGPEMSEFSEEIASDPEVPDDRTLQRPPQPTEYDEGAFTREQLNDYLEEYYDPAVELCKERGVYCIVDFHRHWHEQPPGDGSGNGGPEGDAEAENHLPYDSEYTLYWAYNDYYGKDEPASWGYVDQSYRNEADNPYFDGIEDIRNSDDHPYTQWEVNQDLVDEAVMFWDVVAERYADEPHVIFEPYNEPTAPGIWGPAEGGCGYAKQIPLWETFRQDFAAPIMEQVREHAPDKLMLMGLPGWCQATQALHWGGFDEEGFENVAAVWHNYAGHSASEQENWLNDTDYGGDACNGWEPEESQGLQNAMDVHHIHVTEFGWQEPEYTEENIEGSVNISKWLRGSTTGKGSTEAYGEPVLEALESDDRISWVAWCADARWLPAMFRTDFPINETTFELENGSWYETPDSDFPVNCESLPCDWALWENPNMGAYVKQILADKAEDQVPFELVETTDDDGGEPPGPGEGPDYPEGATDPDDDGYYEDLNGNGETDYSDVVDYFNNMENEDFQSNAEYYDYNGNGEIDYADLVDLFNEI